MNLSNEVIYGRRSSLRKHPRHPWLVSEKEMEKSSEKSSQERDGG